MAPRSSLRLILVCSVEGSGVPLQEGASLGRAGIRGRRSHRRDTVSAPEGKDEACAAGAVAQAFGVLAASEPPSTSSLQLPTPANVQAQDNGPLSPGESVESGG